MLEHCLDEFLPKTKPKPDQNPTSICEKEKILFPNTEKTPEKDEAVKGRRIWKKRQRKTAAEKILA